MQTIQPPYALARRIGPYLAGRFLWNLATQICEVALGWLVYDTTRSAVALGMVGLAAFLPRLLLVLVSGFVADRFDRRVVLGACMLVSASAAAGLWACAGSAQPAIGVAYALVVLLGTARGFAGPSAQALVASIAPRDQLSRAMSLSSTAMQISTILGPALGGLLYVLGPWVPFAFGVAAFLAAAAAFSTLVSPRRDPAQAPPSLTDAFEGFRFIRARPVVLGAISLDMFAVLLGGVTALLPMIVSEILHGGPQMLGVLRAMPAFGAMVLGLWLAVRPIRRRAGRKLFVATAVFGLATIVVGLSSQPWLTGLALWVVGASDVFSVVIRQTLVQGETPDAMRGRVAAVNFLFIGASNELGEFESGMAAAALGLVPAILLGGIGTLAVALTWAWLFPALRRRDALLEA